MLPPGVVNARRAAWLAERRTGLGSSDAPIIAGVSSWKSPFQLWGEKVGLPTEELDGEWLEWGIRLEPVIAEKYAEETGRRLVDPEPFTVLRHPERPWCLATIDRYVADAGQPLGVLELKTAASWKADEWADEPPVAYQVQLQHQLAVTGASWGSLAVLIGGQRFRWCDLPRNDRFIAILLEREAAFWRRVETGDPPPVDGREGTRELLQALYPESTPGQVVALPGAALAWDQQRLEAHAQVQHWTERKTEAENLLKQAIGPAERGIAPNGVTYVWATTTRKAYSVAATTVRTLRRQKGHTDAYAALPAPAHDLPAASLDGPGAPRPDEAANRDGPAEAHESGPAPADRADLDREDAGAAGV